MNQETRNKAILSISALSLSALVIWGAWWLFIPHQMTPGFVKTMARAAQETAAPLAFTPLESLDLADESLARTLATDLQDSAWSDVEQAQFIEGINTVVAFLSARSSGDPDDYLRWTKQQGLTPIATFPTKAPVVKNADWDFLYHFRTGNDPPSPLTPELYFQASYTYYSSIHDGAMRPIGIVTDPLGFEIDVTEFTHFADNFDAIPYVHEGGLGFDFWISGSSWGSLSFFTPERDLRAILETSESTLAMRIRLITVGPTGVRIPTWITQYRDPRSGRWVIQDFRLSLSPSSIGLKKFVGMEY